MGIGGGTLERHGKFCKWLNMKSEEEEEEGKDVAGVSSLDEVRWRIF